MLGPKCKMNWFFSTSDISLIVYLDEVCSRNYELDVIIPLNDFCMLNINSSSSIGGSQ